jgi:spore coat protein U-like protein
MKIRRGLRAVSVGLVALLGATRPSAADGTSCTIASTGVNFGVYNPVSGADALSNGLVVVFCSASTAIKVTLSRGGGKSYLPRSLQNGKVRLSYNLYLDAATSTVWGDGTGGTQAYTDPHPPGGQIVTLPVYGRIPAAQLQATNGSYADTVVVTLTF